MAEVKKITVSFRVMYKWNGKPLVEGQQPNCDQKKYKQPILPGRHAEFEAEEGEEENARMEADAAAEECRKHFNLVKKLKVYRDEDDEKDLDFDRPRSDYSKDRREEVEVMVNEIVNVWVNEYRGGELVKNGEPICEPASSVETAASATSSAAPKSPSISTEKPKANVA